MRIAKPLLDMFAGRDRDYEQFYLRFFRARSSPRRFQIAAGILRDELGLPYHRREDLPSEVVAALNCKSSNDVRTWAREFFLSRKAER